MIVEDPIEVQDAKETARIIATLEACKDDAKNALFAKGLPAYVIREGKLLKLFPDGREEVLKVYA